MSTEKDPLRRRVVRMFSRVAWPGPLSILTFPGLKWEFERLLIASRETKNVISGDHGCRRTHICAIERDEEIFRASMKWMPDHGHIRILPAHPAATASVRNLKVARYHRCSFEDYVDQSDYRHDVAWLDFNGQISERRMEAIEKFWREQLRTTLVLTLLNARHCAPLNVAVARSGGLAAFLADRLRPARIDHAAEYSDTAPMLQIALSKGRSR